jgi:geranylgeranyl diphosphate synthase type II
MEQPALSTTLSSYLSTRRALIEARLVGYLDDETASPPRLVEAMRYSLLGPGKRLRPVLVLMACEACGGTVEAALPAACALEMIHTYSLVHDDLPAMDDDDLRRGRPTCHKQFDEATAILVGDALLTLAFQVISADTQPPELAARCCLELARGSGAAGMVGGQFEDLAWEQRRDGSLDVLEAIHRMKTGALFRAALRIGALIGERGRVSAPSIGAPSAKLEALDRYAQCLGLAFQISDDLLDVESSAEKTGKRVGKDAAAGKLTYPGLLGVAESKRRLDAVCAEACEHLAILGDAASYLKALVQLIKERDR